jgi:hypothetical protein
MGNDDTLNKFADGDPREGHNAPEPTPPESTPPERDILAGAVPPIATPDPPLGYIAERLQRKIDRLGTAPDPPVDRETRREPPPDSSPESGQWCRRCNAHVQATAKGQCERCHSFLRGNFSAAKPTTNLARRRALLADLLQEFQPCSVINHSRCQHLAAAYEQLEGLRPGTSEWTRLMQTVESLSAALQASRPRETPAPDLDELTADQLVERASALLTMATELRDRARASATTDTSPTVIDTPSARPSCRRR